MSPCSNAHPSPRRLPGLMRSRISRAVWAAPLALACTVGKCEMPPSELQRVIKSMPSGPLTMKRSGGTLIAEYCPDNTCEVIQVKAQSSVDAAYPLLAGYFYYFSTYTYLEEWRRDKNIESALAQSLLQSKTGRCPYQGKDLVRCELISLNSGKGRVTILDIRYDEGRKTSLQLNIQEALK